MGIVKNGILGTVVNKVGAVIGKTVRGQNVLTGLSKVPNKPESADQREQQYRFGLLAQFFGSHSELVELGFKRKAKQQSPMTTAFSYNYPKAFFIQEQVKGAPEIPFSERITLDYSSLCYSVGPIHEPNCGTAIRNSDASCTFSWLDYPQSRDSQNTDRAGYLILNASTGRQTYQLDVASRGSLEFNVIMPLKTNDDKLHFYMHFFNPITNVWGDSVYLGSTL